MRYVAFAADGAQIRSRAAVIGSSLAGLGGSLAMVLGSEEPSRYFLQFGFERLVGLALIVSAPAVLHSGVGLLTDLGVIPRVVMRRSGEGWEVTAFSRILQGDWLPISPEESVVVDVTAKKRQGLFAVGFKAIVRIASAGRQLEIPVVCGDPSVSAARVAEGLASMGLAVGKTSD